MIALCCCRHFPQASLEVSASAVAQPVRHCCQDLFLSVSQSCLLILSQVHLQLQGYVKICEWLKWQRQSISHSIWAASLPSSPSSFLLDLRGVPVKAVLTIVGISIILIFFGRFFFVSNFLGELFWGLKSTGTIIRMHAWKAGVGQFQLGPTEIVADAQPELYVVMLWQPRGIMSVYPDLSLPSGQHQLHLNRLSNLSKKSPVLPISYSRVVCSTLQAMFLQLYGSALKWREKWEFKD